MSICTILCDSREQKGYAFDRYPVDTKTVTLSTGDYTIAACCDYDESLDTYHPWFAVERKSASDFLSSISSNRDRFKEEIKRADEWDDPLHVVVEAPWTVFTNNHGPMEYRSLTPSQVEGTVREWSKYYNVSFQFTSDRTAAEQYTFDELVTRYRMQHL